MSLEKLEIALKGVQKCRVTKGAFDLYFGSFKILLSTFSRVSGSLGKFWALYKFRTSRSHCLHLFWILFQLSLSVCFAAAASFFDQKLAEMLRKGDFMIGSVFR